MRNNFSHRRGKGGTGVAIMGTSFKPLPLFIVIMCFVLFGISIIRYVIDDECGGYQYTRTMCDQYEKSLISGSLCDAVCRTRTVRLTHCSLHSHGYRIFHQDYWDVKIPIARFSPDAVGASADSFFLEPTEGKSVKEFDDMLQSRLADRIGSIGDQKVIIQRILDLSDVNRDTKVSLAEARTIWSLVQHDEFLFLILLRKSSYIHHVIDFCGDAFRLEPTGKKIQIFDTPAFIPGQSMWSSIAHAAHRLAWPQWRDRVKLAIGLLEFVEEIYEHEDAGALFLCAENAEAMFRYAPDGKFETRVVDLGGIWTREQIRTAVRGRSCMLDSDCQLWQFCSTRCNVDISACEEDLVRPNLYRACAMIEEYILTGAPPRRFRAELSVLFDRCAALNSTTVSLQHLEHSLVLNDLRSLLWNHATSRI